MYNNSTIAAICTPKGSSSVSMIRVSGEDSIKIVNQIFRPLTDGFNLEKDSKPNRIYNGFIVDNSDVIDRVVLLVYKSPNSYTGEDIVEICCHSSAYILKLVLDLLFKHGCHSAKPGEFTMRAYLNKKMDLTEAEAVADLISATSEKSHKIAINQLRGGIKNEISNLRAELLHFCSLLELELDFSEEDVEFANRKEFNQILDRTKEYLNKLISSYKKGNAIKNGVPVAIVGMPNAGKSTLLNALLNEERAIVSHIPGTTRDIVEDTMVIDGVNYRFIDTAGIRQTEDYVEKLGIERAKNAINQADIILFVLDIEKDINLQYQELIEDKEDKTIIYVINKVDKSSFEKEKFPFLKDKIVVPISAKNKEGITELENQIAKLSNLEVGSDDVILTNARHQNLFVESLEAITRAQDAMNNMVSSEFVSQDIRLALMLFSEITGDEITPDEVLGNIFKNFCIGK